MEVDDRTEVLNFYVKYAYLNLFDRPGTSSFHLFGSHFFNLFISFLLALL